MEEGRLNLKVEGMTCNHCASTVSGIIKQEGGQDIHVDYLMGEANFDLGNTEKITRIVKRLTAAGYPAHSDQDAALASSGLSSIEKKFLFTLPFSLVLFSHMFVPTGWILHNPYVQLALCIPVFTLGFYHFGKSTFESVKSGNINMDVLILMGSTSAFFYSLYGTLSSTTHHEASKFLFYETTSTIITLVLLGYVIEHRAVQKTTNLLRDLFKSQPDKAKKLIQKGLNQELEVVSAASLSPGDLILVNAGDRIPADGTITHGGLTLNEAMITGEAELIYKKRGDEVLSGSIITDGSGTVEVLRSGAESTIGQIIALVKASRSDKPAVQKLADRISSWFVPTIMLIALLTFAVNYLVMEVETGSSLLRSIAVLVIACPCAMGLATPTAVSVGLGLAAKLGIIVKKASAFEEINALKTIVFDKTGTLTKGADEIILDEMATEYSMETTWGIVRALEKHSNHPIALRILSISEGVEPVELQDIVEVKGKGMQALWQGKEVRFGSPEFSISTAHHADLILSVDRQFAAAIRIKDSLKEGAIASLNHLRREGKKLMIISGDSESKTRAIAEETGIKDYRFRQLPSEKLAIIRALKEQQPTGMVGDGINDSPSLAMADVGISMGNANALAAESAKVVILGNKMDLLERLFKISKRVVRTIKQNLFWAFAYNLIAIPLAAAGYLDPMLAALSMAFSDVVVIGNSLRLRLILPKSTL